METSELRDLIAELDADDQEALEEYLVEKQLQKARENPIDFIEYVMTDDKGNPLELASMHRRWHEIIQEHQFTQIIAPREHGKTTNIIGYVLWKIGQNPNIRIKIVCQSNSNAIDRLKTIKQYIAHSDRYREVFPHVYPSEEEEDWKQQSITVNRKANLPDSTVEAWGILSSSVGGRADLIVFDDVQDLKNAVQNPKNRKHIKEAFRGNWLNMLGPDGEAIYIATKWHEDDLTCELQEGDAFYTEEWAIGENYEPVWPERWDVEGLKKKEKQITKREFDRGFRNQPLSDQDRLFDDVALERIQGDFDIRSLLNRYKGRNIYIGCDPALGTEDMSSFTVFFVVLCDPKDRRYVLDIRRGKWKATQIVEEMIELNDLYNPLVFMVENNSFQEALIEYAEAMSRDSKSNLKIEPYRTGAQKTDPSIGVPSLAVEMRQGLWKADYDRDEHRSRGCKCNLCSWYQELQSWPIGKNTDIVMANWLALKAIQEGPVSRDVYDRQAKQIQEFLRRESMGGRPELRGVIDHSHFS